MMLFKETLNNDIEESESDRIYIFGRFLNENIKRKDLSIVN